MVCRTCWLDLFGGRFADQHAEVGLEIHQVALLHRFQALLDQPGDKFVLDRLVDDEPFGARAALARVPRLVARLVDGQVHVAVRADDERIVAAKLELIGGEVFGRHAGRSPCPPPRRP